MKFKTIKRSLSTFAVNRLLVGTRFYGLKRRLLGACGCRIGKNTRIVGPVYNTGTLIVGDNCWIGKNLTVHGNGAVIIGDNCDIAPEVMFLTGGHRIGPPDRRAGAGETYEITVGSGTWIGARATILKNTHIGVGTVVAACACVTADTGDHVLVGGVPAGTIGELSHD